jgi:biopolymer transport protein TolR
MSYIPRRKRTRATLSDIPLTPLIDTALTLLIIFMVASPMLNNIIKVTLPRSAVQEGGAHNQELVVYVDKENLLFFDGKSMEVGAIIEQLKTLTATKKDAVVFVKADEGAQYGKIINLISAIKLLAGIQYVALATQKCA